VLNAYILTFGGLLLLGARAGDLHGRRRVFLGGIALFTISSLAGGLAVSGWMLLTARAMQGVGAALAAPSALSLLTMVFPAGPERVRAIGLYTTVSAAGGALGLVSGGFLTELVSWRWVMFVNVPIGIAILMVGSRVLRESERRHGRFDLVGAVTSTVGMSGIVFGLVESGTAGWSSALTIGSLLAGVILIAMFVATERKAEEPILPLRLLAHRTRSTANAARGLVYAGMYGMFFFLGQFLQDVQGYSPLRAGLAFLPLPASVFLSSQLTSRVLVRRFPQRAVMLLGITSSMVGLLLVTQLQASAFYGQIAMALVLMGAGAGVSFVSLTSASLADVAPADAGAASGLINVSQQLGAAVGLAVLVTIFDSATHNVGTAPTAEEFVHGVRTVCLVGAGFAVAALTLVATVFRPARLTQTDDDTAQLAEHTAVELV
jgi:EmrB/QacA subfamily drug resistance transporter